jgi:hypothetical protein
MRISEKDSIRYAEALAEALAWFGGFAAARPEAPMPSGLSAIGELGKRMKIVERAHGTKSGLIGPAEEYHSTLASIANNSELE